MTSYPGKRHLFINWDKLCSNYVAEVIFTEPLAPIFTLGLHPRNFKNLKPLTVIKDYIAFKVKY